jgi:hypothetical protein
MFGEDRYTRQRRLQEVGDAGQARIAGSRLEVIDSDGALVEAMYLYRAGVERVSITPRAGAEPFAHAGVFHFPASRSAGAGAWRALEKLRGVLEGGT